MTWLQIKPGESRVCHVHVIFDIYRILMGHIVSNLLS